MEGYRRGIVNGTDNSEIQLLSIKAQWMMNGGKTSEDWDNMTVQDMKLLIVDYYAKEERASKMMVGALKEALFGKKKGR